MNLKQLFTLSKTDQLFQTNINRVEKTLKTQIMQRLRCEFETEGATIVAKSINRQGFLYVQCL